MLALSGGGHTYELLMQTNRGQMEPVQMLGRVDGRADYAPLIGWVIPPCLLMHTLDGPQTTTYPDIRCLAPTGAGGTGMATSTRVGCRPRNGV